MQLFGEDERGVSGVVGFMLIFAIIIIAISINQAKVVPQENAEIEFQHYQDVQDDMVELRNGVSTTGLTGESQFTSVKLGTMYPVRVLAANPAPPSGMLRTTTPYNITVENTTDSVTVQTRFIEYRPNYNELQVGSVWYENSVVYIDERQWGDGRFAVVEDQNLVGSSGSVRVTPVQNNLERTGTETVSIELYSTDEVGQIPTGDVTIRLPTRLSGSEYWADAVPGSVYQAVNADAYETGVHELVLEANTDDVEFNTVGVQSAPTDAHAVTEETATNDPPTTVTGPTITSFDATNTHPTHAQFDVTATADAGDNGITSATVELVDDTGTVVDTAQWTYGGVNTITIDEANAVSENGGAGSTYTLELTVTDSAGETATQTITRTA